MASSGKSTGARLRPKRTDGVVTNNIHREGQGAVSRLLKLVDGLTLCPTAREGDVVLDGNIYEVKSTAKATLGQVRAVKYIPLIAYQSMRHEWYVIPPQDVVRMAAEKQRGQHTEIPFECALFTLPSPIGKHYAAWQKWRVQETELPAAMRAAHLSGAAHPQIKLAMQNVIEDARMLAERARLAVLDELL